MLLVSEFSRSSRRLCSRMPMKHILAVLTRVVLAILVLGGFAALLVALLVFTPLLPLWAINTLFHTTIPYTFWTWLAVVVIKATVIQVVKSARS